MNGIARARHELLSLATEDAYELFWAAGTVGEVFPENTHDQNRELAKELLKDLIDAGLVQLLTERRHLLPPAEGERHRRAMSEYFSIPREEAEAILTSDASWEGSTAEGECIAFQATQDGKREYGLLAE